jgi:hypothetical protein
MNKNVFISLIGVIVIGGILVFAFVAKAPVRGPQAVTDTFYASWVGSDGDALTNRLYADRADVTAGFVERMDAIVASLVPQGYDPIVCSQNAPSGFVVGSPRIDTDTATVPVTLDYADGVRIATVGVERDGSAWKINAVTCPVGSDYSSRDGVLVKGNPGLDPEFWHLVGEAPGAPAVVTSLSFMDDGQCTPGEAFVVCGTTAFKTGDRVTAQGVLDGTELIIANVSFHESVATQNINLYYYNVEADTDADGMILCSSEGLVPVTRTVAQSSEMPEHAVRLLIEGIVTPHELSQDIETEYPLSGLTLSQASLSNGTLTLTFEDPEGATGGGSCRVGILWSQINRTAQQFPTVDEVSFLSDELFQP